MGFNDQIQAVLQTAGTVLSSVGTVMAVTNTGNTEIGGIIAAAVGAGLVFVKEIQGINFDQFQPTFDAVARIETLLIAILQGKQPPPSQAAFSPASQSSSEFTIAEYQGIQVAADPNAMAKVIPTTDKRFADAYALWTRLHGQKPASTTAA